jgi:OPT family oligopeptide transporter
MANAAPAGETHPEIASQFGPGVPHMPEGLTPEQKDEFWFRHVYKGDKMPQLTIRAVLMGGFLGMLMSASNLYTTLSIGWAFGVAITASVMSFVIWNGVRLISGKAVSQMSILETNCMSSTASAAGYSTGSTIGTMFGAMLLLEKGPDSAQISTWQVQPIWIVGAFTLATGAMGVFLAIPMKRQMINHEQLPFPSGIAAAETLRSLYSASKEAAHKAYALIVALGVGVLVGILNTGQGTLALLDRVMNRVPFLRLPEQIPEKGFIQYNNGKSLIGFGFEPSVLLIAAGLIVGLRVSLSMLASSIILYFVVAPYLIGVDLPHYDATRGTVEGIKWFQEGYTPNIELVAGGQIYHVYRWGLWGGTALMVFSSLTAVAVQWKTIARAFSGFRKGQKVGESTGNSELAERMAQVEVPSTWMFIGMVPITVALVAVQMLAFNISWWAGLIAVAMSFILSLVACRATGETDTTPIGAMGKVMQLMFALFHPGKIIPNLASAGVAANGASSSADLLTDLKSGYLLGANPRKQFIAQAIGLLFGLPAVLFAWYMMIPNKAALEKFPAPGTNQWKAVAEVLTKGVDSLPKSAQLAILIGAAIGIALPLIETFLVPKKYRKYMPSAMGIGLAFILPFANSLAFTLGATIAWVWSKIHKKSQEGFNVPVASGLIAGEGLIKAIIAISATVLGLMGMNS